MIKILGHEFKLILKDDYRSDNRINPDRDFGLTNNLTKEICIDTSIVGWFETLLHECTHIINEKFRIGLNEDDVARISEGMFCILKDNKLLIDDVENVLIQREGLNEQI